MTQKQRAELDAAIMRAARDGIAVMGKGRSKDGRTVYAVSSASQPGRWYLVAIEGGRLHCDCPARSYCKHRAAVHARLEAERDAAQAASARERSLEADRQAERAYWRDCAHEANELALAPSL